MVITYANVKQRLGNIEANLGTGSNLIVNEAIADSYSYLMGFTGSNTTHIMDMAAADYAASKVVDTMMGRDDQTVSTDYLNMSTRLKDSAMDKVKVIGRKGSFKITDKT